MAVARMLCSFPFVSECSTIVRGTDFSKPYEIMSRKCYYLFRKKDTQLFLKQIFIDQMRDLRIKDELFINIMKVIY